MTDPITKTKCIYLTLTEKQWLEIEVAACRKRLSEEVLIQNLLTEYFKQTPVLSLPLHMIANKPKTILK